MQRDFTYIDDVIEGLIRVLHQPPQIYPIQNAGPDGVPSEAPYKLYNIGNNTPVELLTFITAIEQALGKKAHKNLLPMQPGEVLCTYADIDDLIKDTGFKPTTSIEEGIDRFVRWYRDYYQE